MDLKPLTIRMRGGDVTLVVPEKLAPVAIPPSVRERKLQARCVFFVKLGFEMWRLHRNKVSKRDLLRVALKTVIRYWKAGLV